LRTPLARLRNHLERAAITDVGSDRIIPEAVEQLDEVLGLFAAILRLAEVESGETRRYFAPVDLTALLTELAESYAAAFEDNGRTLQWSIEPDLEVEGDRDLLAQAVVNLVENAQRHTPRGTTVRMSASASLASIAMEVADDGPGVPDRELPNIAKRFARLETSRNTDGHGLGLSLVSAVAKLHGGHLHLTNCGPGLRARLEIPRSGKERSAAMGATRGSASAA
jgi:signal transduction histidine kinase